MPELGSWVMGDAIGKNPKTKYFWVDCPTKGPNCLGERYTSITNYKWKSTTQVRCIPCKQALESRGFKLNHREDPYKRTR